MTSKFRIWRENHMTPKFRAWVDNCNLVVEQESNSLWTWKCDHGKAAFTHKTKDEAESESEWHMIKVQQDNVYGNAVPN